MNTKIGQRPLNLAIVLATVLGLTALTVPAYATQAANLTVSADINASCTISTTDLSFGTYDAYCRQRITRPYGDSHDINDLHYRFNRVITMGGGHHGHLSSDLVRHMKNEGSNSYLKYEIYADAGHTFVWNYDQTRMRSVAR